MDMIIWILKMMHSSVKNFSEIITYQDNVNHDPIINDLLQPYKLDSHIIESEVRTWKVFRMVISSVHSSLSMKLFWGAIIDPIQIMFKGLS